MLKLALSRIFVPGRFTREKRIMGSGKVIMDEIDITSGSVKLTDFVSNLLFVTSTICNLFKPRLYFCIK